MPNFWGCRCCGGQASEVTYRVFTTAGDLVWSKNNQLDGIWIDSGNRVLVTGTTYGPPIPSSYLRDFAILDVSTGVVTLSQTASNNVHSKWRKMATASDGSIYDVWSEFDGLTKYSSSFTELWDETIPGAFGGLWDYSSGFPPALFGPALSIGEDLVLQTISGPADDGVLIYSSSGAFDHYSVTDSRSGAILGAWFDADDNYYVAFSGYANFDGANICMVGKFASDGTFLANIGTDSEVHRLLYPMKRSPGFLLGWNGTGFNSFPSSPKKIYVYDYDGTTTASFDLTDSPFGCTSTINEMDVDWNGNIFVTFDNSKLACFDPGLNPVWMFEENPSGESILSLRGLAVCDTHIAIGGFAKLESVTDDNFTFF